MSDDLRIIDGTSDFHIFQSGERVTILREFPRDKYLVENKDGQQDVVLDEHIRGYSPTDEYDDMYCTTCGGTACGC